MSPKPSGFLFGLLAHPERRRICLALRDGEAPAHVVVERVFGSAASTSRHLAALEAAGIVTVRRRGRERIYRLESERLLAMAGEWLRNFQKPHAA
jgi:DNA-binding transcriptional ArsR family regulator